MTPASSSAPRIRPPRAGEQWLPLYQGNGRLGGCFGPWGLHAHPDAVYSGRGPFTAEDVVFSFWRYKAAQAKTIQGKTEKVEAVNPHLVRYHFKESFPDFLEYFLPSGSGIGWIAPKK